MKVLVATLLLCSVAFAGDPVDSRIKLAEDAFSASVNQAEADCNRIKVTAASKRLASYREVLKSATKAGDFDKATKIKERIVELEATAPGVKRPRPKDTARLQGHSYALIRELCTWHVAKKRCEEMGGHLAIIETAGEADFISRKMCGGHHAWVGATDEDEEGNWRWINGSHWTPQSGEVDNSGGAEHFLLWNGSRWNDECGCQRKWYLCEWE